MGSSLLRGGAPLGLPATALAAPRAKEQQDTLQALLARNRRLRPEYGPGYSNHVSMGLFALAALGGSARQLRAFADDSWGPLEPLPEEAGPSITRESFTSQLGQRAALRGYRSLFERELRQHGRAATLERYVPELLPGLGAAAFHPLIRTGYGVRFGDDGEVADGLAYWATAHLPLGPLGAPGKEAEPRVLLRQLRKARHGKGSSNEGRLILDHLRSATRVPEFAPTVGALEPRPDTLRRLALLALELYTETDGNFTALHAVTGTHGLRMLWPHVPQKEVAARYLWQALVAAYLTVGAPELPEQPRALEPGRAVPDWEQIVAKAVESTDAHDLKLVDVAREEGNFHQVAGYRRAAARRLRLL
jgi:hypothetical protein